MSCRDICLINLDLRHRHLPEVNKYVRQPQACQLQPAGHDHTAVPRGQLRALPSPGRDVGEAFAHYRQRLPLPARFAAWVRLTLTQSGWLGVPDLAAPRKPVPQISLKISESLLLSPYPNPTQYSPRGVESSLEGLQ